jgi:hypothetical protein
MIRVFSLLNLLRFRLFFFFGSTNLFLILLGESLGND